MIVWRATELRAMVDVDVPLSAMPRKVARVATLDGHDVTIVAEGRDVRVYMPAALVGVVSAADAATRLGAAIAEALDASNAPGAAS